MQITIGADPEIFVRKNGKNFSAYDLIPGNKVKPHPVERGAVQVDGMALEFNIDPAKSKEEFVHNIKIVMGKLREMVPPEYELSITASAQFDKQYMADQPLQALLLGCDPDYNAYTEKKNKAPKASPDMRAAGGHVHVGWTEGQEPNEGGHFSSCCQLARQLDFFLGLPSIILDDDRLRRRMYGGAGAFRPKSYGMEYRTLSNFWIKEEGYMEFVYKQTERAFNQLVVERRDYQSHWPNAVPDYIALGEKNRAREAIRALLNDGYQVIEDSDRKLLGI